MGELGLKVWVEREGLHKEGWQVEMGSEVTQDPSGKTA